MSTELSPDNERFVAREIANGTFRSRDEVLDAGVELLKQRKTILDQVDEGRRQLDGGEYVDYDEKSLGERFSALKQRLTKQSGLGQDEG